MKGISFERYINSFEVFGRYSEEYEYQLEHLISVADENLKDRFSILDIGAGTGFFVKDFIKESKLSPFSYTAIEPSEKHITYIKENFKEFNFEIDIINDIFTPETSFNTKFDLMVMSHCVYWFIPDPGPYILNALNFLDDDGVLVIYSQTPFTASYILNMLFEKYLPSERAPNTKITSWTILDILEDNNLNYDVSILPGTFNANDLFKEYDKKILDEVISFFLSVESESLDKKTLERAEEALERLSVEIVGNVKLNMEVGAITVFF